MLSALSGNFLMQNIAYFVKAGETKQTLFKFKDIDFKSYMYNQVGNNIVSQRIDRVIQTNWNLDFQIKDNVVIDNETYMIVDIPPFQKINPLGQFDKLTTLRLLKRAN